MDKLFFEGRSLSAVSVSGRYFTISVRGNGRRWSTGRPLAFWRVFAEIDLGSKSDVEMFLRRYGDPFLHLTGAPNSVDAEWVHLHGMLRAAAHGWEAEGHDGVSRVTRKHARLQRARFFLGEDAPVPGPGAKISFYDVWEGLDSKTGVPVRHARTLSAFMLASASRMLDSSTPMRRCAECGHWTDASHAATRYCSNACRLAASRRKGA